MKHEPTYDELKAQASERWHEIAKAREQKFTEMHEELAQSPDVLMQPRVGEPWSHHGVICPCHGTSFLLTPGRWVTISGKKHRAELTCTACQRIGTWDWHTMEWVTDARA